MFVNHIIKTVVSFGHSCLTIFRGRFPCLVLLLLLCLFASSSCLFGMWLYVVCVCVVPDVLVCGRLGCVSAWCTCLWEVRLCECLMYLSDKYIRHSNTHKHTHTHRQYTATYQINNLTTQTNRELVTARSKEDGPMKMVKQEWPKHVGVLMMWFTNIFNILVF
jgi:hypothetical protein